MSVFGECAFNRFGPIGMYNNMGISFNINHMFGSFGIIKTITS